MATAGTSAHVLVDHLPFVSSTSLLALSFAAPPDATMKREKASKVKVQLNDDETSEEAEVLSGHDRPQKDGLTAAHAMMLWQTAPKDTKIPFPRLRRGDTPFGSLEWLFESYDGAVDHALQGRDRIPLPSLTSLVFCAVGSAAGTGIWLQRRPLS